MIDFEVMQRLELVNWAVNMCQRVQVPEKGRIFTLQQKDRKFKRKFYTIAQLGVQYGHMGYYFMTVAFMLVIVMLLSCCVPYHVVLLLDVMFVHVLHLSCLVCMYPNCFVAFPLYILVHGCPCFL